MKLDREFEQTLQLYVEKRRDRLIAIIQDLVRIPSENTPPTGDEAQCQRYVTSFLHRQGWQAKVYSPDEVPSLQGHPLFWSGRDYTNRPNVTAQKKGRGSGRSLLLSGHIDTVPRGTQPWSRDPLGAQIVENRLYGRGSNDMKAGIGAYLFIVEALESLGVELCGDLIVESVVDEEFGGVNGTLAGRLMGFNAEAAVISEPTSLRICPAQQGGRIAHITFQASGGILAAEGRPEGVADQVRHFLAGIQEFGARRRQTTEIHELYAHLEDPVPVFVTKIHTGPWGSQEPISVPDRCKLELYWQTMPGEKQGQVEAEFQDWFDDLIASAPGVYPQRPAVEFPIRWLPGSAISRSDPLVREFAASAADTLGDEPPIVGLEAPCDMYVFHQAFNTPALLWGPKGGNTHAADEYLEIDSIVAATKTLLTFACRWCGVAP